MSDESKKLTVNDFKMWLGGVEEMQTEDWIPDARQWKRIREKIDQLHDVPQIQAAHYSASNYPVAANPLPPVAFELPTSPAGPTHTLPPVFSTGASRSTVTPNIDTSSGTYTSIFAG